MPKATIPIYHDDDFERLAELRMEVAIAERGKSIQLIDGRCQGSCRIFVG